MQQLGVSRMLPSEVIVAQHQVKHTAFAIGLRPRQLGIVFGMVRLQKQMDNIAVISGVNIPVLVSLYINHSSLDWNRMVYERGLEA